MYPTDICWFLKIKAFFIRPHLATRERKCGRRSRRKDFLFFHPFVLLLVRIARVFHIFQEIRGSHSGGVGGSKLFSLCNALYTENGCPRLERSMCFLFYIYLFIHHIPLHSNTTCYGFTIITLFTIYVLPVNLHSVTFFIFSALLLVDLV